MMSFEDLRPLASGAKVLSLPLALWLCTVLS